VGILALVVGVGGDLIISSVRSYNKSQILNTLSQNGGFAVSTFKGEAQNAKNIITCTSSTLTLTNKDGALVIYTLAPFTACPANGSFVRNVAGDTTSLLNTAGTTATVRILPSDGSNTSGFVCNGNLVTVTLILAQACDSTLGSNVRIDSSAVSVLKTAVVVRGTYK
jgi:hypothetical protein